MSTHIMMRKSGPLTLWLSPDMGALVTEGARRTRPKGVVVAALAEEVARTRLFPGIAFRGADWGRRPWVIGTALDVWEIVRAYQDVGSIERMVHETDLTERQISLALAYHGRFPEAGRRHAGCAIIVGIGHGEFGVILHVLDAALAARPQHDDWLDYTCFVSRHVPEQ